MAHALRFFVLLTVCAGAGARAAEAPELALQIGHTDAVIFVSFVDDDRRIVSVGGDGTAIVWDVTTGKQIRVLAHVPEPLSVHGAVDEEARRLYLSDMYGARAFDLEDGTELGVYTPEADRIRNMRQANLVGVLPRVGQMSASGGRLMVSEPLRRYAKIWDFGEDEEPYATALVGTNLFNIAEAELSEMLTSDISPDGESVVVAYLDGSITTLNTRNGKVRREFTLTPTSAAARLGGFATGMLLGGIDDAGLRRGLEDVAEMVDVIEVAKESALRVRYIDEGRVLSGHLGGDAVIWTRRGRIDKRFEDGHESGIVDLTLSDDEARLATAGLDGVVQVWDVRREEIRQTLRGHEGTVYSVAFSRDGRYLLSGGGDHEVVLWDLELGEEVRRFSREGVPFSAARFAAGNDVLYTGYFDDPLVRRWDLTAGTMVPAFEDPGAGVFDLDVSPDGSLVANASRDGMARVFDADGTQLAELEHVVGDREPIDQTLNRVLGLASRAGDMTAAITGGLDLTGVRSVRFSPSGELVATAGRGPGRIRLWDPRDGALVDESNRGFHLSGALAFAPDSDDVLAYGTTQTLRDYAVPRTASDDTLERGATGRIAAWNRAEDDHFNIGPIGGRLKYEPRKDDDLHMGGVFGLAFLPGGEHVVSGSGDRLGSVWSVDRDTRDAFLRGHEGRVAAVDVSVDGARIATGSYDGVVRLWDGETFEEVAVLDAHESKIHALDFSPDGSRLITASSDGTVRVWDGVTGAEIARLIAVDERDWVIATPDNYYLASKFATSRVAFRIGNDTYPFEQFDLRLNRPDIVLERLGFASPERIAALRAAHDKRLERLGFRPEDLSEDYTIPLLEVAEPPPVSTEVARIRLEASATATGAPLDRLNVYVNDVPVDGARGMSLADAGEAWSGTLSIELSAGRNKIQITVLDAAGNASRMETFEVTRTGAPAARRLHVVAVGVSDYADDAIADLTYPSKDAADLAAALEARTEEFDEVIVHRLVDAEATRDAIVGLRERLLETTVDDQVIVFFAGHGILDQNLDYYFATHDMLLDDMPGTGLRYADIENLLDGIPAREKLLLMDTCFAGETDAGTMDIEDVIVVDGASAPAGSRGLGGAGRDTRLETSFELQQSLFVNLERGNGSVVVAAAAGDQYALENAEWRNGVFTYSVLQALEGHAADADGDGRVRVSELKEFVDESVSALTYGEQTPTARTENIEFDYVVY